MLTIKRLAIYLITFLITFILALNLGNWKKLDNYLVGYSNRTSEQKAILNKEIVFIHLDQNPPGQSGCESFYLKRRNTIDLLYAIAEQSKINNGPKGVVLDIWFGRDNTELDNLLAAIKNLKELNIPVYAAYNINASNESVVIDSVDIDNLEGAHLTEVYNILSSGSEDKHSGSGRYHTNFYPEKNMSSYENDFYFYSNVFRDSTLIESLAYKVVRDLGDSNTMLLEEKRKGSIVPYASIGEMQLRSYFFSPDSILSIQSFIPYNGMDLSQTIDMDKKILIVGDPVNDVIDLGSSSIPGPYVVSWAISDLLDENIRLKLPLESIPVIIGQMLFFALFVALVYALIFKYIKILQTKPFIIGILSFLTILLLLFIYYKLILTFKAVIPVGQTIAAIGVSAALCWRFAHKFLATGIAEGSQKYDIFISYSHGPKADWVEKNVYEPLAAYRNLDGDKLNIFFDKKSIGIGEKFTSKYMWAIVNSKCIIPVITDEYYGKNHCRNELDLAVNRTVEKLININMLVFNYEAVPEPYRTFNYIEVGKDSHFIDIITSSLEKE
ncbi:toll/interleukin-1 receptor domain-containing protein [uncultured Lutibacter sp.]|uniref:toll/interleukin-1 receptor domain-containing protein n=1 Tax=uncultured Lutibacter sp. TaxID=437739 RepID=UPI002603B415|nr:toll/interleukin-1 receptor domain-containing protein [uncultured Lutibacter sp.]